MLGVICLVFWREGERDVGNSTSIHKRVFARRLYSFVEGQRPHTARIEDLNFLTSSPSGISENIDIWGPIVFVFVIGWWKKKNYRVQSEYSTMH